jgi:hypothetical protein
MKFKRVAVKPFDKYKFEVVEDLKVSLNCIDFTLPKGYTTDGASIPRIFWSLYPPYKPEWLTACVIHDYLCSQAMHAQDKYEAYKLADLAFKESLEYLKVNKITVFIFYHWCDKLHKLRNLLDKLGDDE